MSPITEHEDGTPKVETQDAVPREVINKLDCLQHEGKSLYESIAPLKCGMVPDGYISSPWHPNVSKETLLDMLRTIVATYRFRNEVAKLKTSGVDFSKYTYVPEPTMRKRTTITCSSVSLITQEKVVQMAST